MITKPRDETNLFLGNFPIYPNYRELHDGMGWDGMEWSGSRHYRIPQMVIWEDFTYKYTEIFILTITLLSFLYSNAELNY